MKHCNGCDRDLDLSAFGKNKAKKDGLQSQCTECRVRYNAEHYIKTKERWKVSRTESRERCRKRNQQWLREYLSTHHCVDCNASDIRVLEFDHTSNKVADISKLMCAPLLVLKEEVAKCQVRCKNCHAIKTYERLGNVWRMGP